MSDALVSPPHLSEAELAALIYTSGQNRDLERRAYSHLATCAECTTLLGSLRETDREIGRALSSLDVAVPSRSAASVIRMAGARRTHSGFDGRRAAAIVGILFVATAAAAALTSSPFHRFVTGLMGSRGGAASYDVTQGLRVAQPASPAVSFVIAPGSELEVAFGGSGVGGRVDVRVLDGDQVTLSSPGSGASYRIGTNRIAVDQTTPATFRLEIPRSLRELRVRVGGAVVFDGRPVTDASANGFTIQLTRPHASR